MRAGKLNYCLTGGIFALALGVSAAEAETANLSASQFLKDPDSLLKEYSAGGLPLVREVRSLIVEDARVVDRILEIAPKGSAAQEASIGAGMAQASKLLVDTNPEAVKKIQEAVAKSDIGPLVTAYGVVAGGVQTSSIGTGPGAGFGGTGLVGGVPLSQTLQRGANVPFTSGFANGSFTPGASSTFSFSGGSSTSNVGTSAASGSGSASGSGTTITQTFNVGVGCINMIAGNGGSVTITGGSTVNQSCSVSPTRL